MGKSFSKVRLYAKARECLEEAKAAIEEEMILTNQVDDEEKHDAHARILIDLSRVYVKLGLHQKASEIIPCSPTFKRRVSLPVKRSFSQISKIPNQKTPSFKVPKRVIKEKEKENSAM